MPFPADLFLITSGVLQTAAAELDVFGLPCFQANLGRGNALCVCVWGGSLRGLRFDMYIDTFTLGTFIGLSALPKFILYFFLPVDLDGNVPDLQVAH